VTGTRARGVVLYSLAAALLLGGAFWYVRAAPSSAGTAADPRVAGWRAAAGRLLPDVPQQVTAGTVVISGGTSAQRTQPVTGGSYTLSMICLGDHGAVRVRLSGKGYDSGRAVPCAATPQPVTVTVGLADQFYMLADAETDSAAAVFRWRLERAGGF
jgi:Family of unknown function (DUF6023)